MIGIIYCERKFFYSTQLRKEGLKKKSGFAGIWTLYDTGQDKRSNQYS